MYPVKNFSLKNGLLTLGVIALSFSGCSYKNDCYKPKAKQGYEDVVCYAYDDALFSNHRFIYMNKNVWMMYKKQYLVEARDFNITVNEHNTTKTTSYTVLSSDHDFDGYSNLLVNIDFLKQHGKIDSLSYNVTNKQEEIEPQKLGFFSVMALNNILDLARSESNKTK